MKVAAVAAVLRRLRNAIKAAKKDPGSIVDIDNPVIERELARSLAEADRTLLSLDGAS